MFWLAIIIAAIFILALVFFLTVLFDAIKFRRLRKTYDAEKDLSKKGEELGSKPSDIAGISGIGTAELDITGSSESAGSELLQEKSSDRTGKNRKGSRGFFKRRNRR